MQRMILTGNIGQVNGITKVGEEAQVCKFSVADTERYMDKASNQMKEKTTWFNVDVWGRAGSFDNMLAKNIIAPGNKVSLVGKMERSQKEQNGPVYWTLRLESLRDFHLEQMAAKYRDGNGQQGGGAPQQGGNFGGQQGGGQQGGNFGGQQGGGQQGGNFGGQQGGNFGGQQGGGQQGGNFGGQQGGGQPQRPAAQQGGGQPQGGNYGGPQGGGAPQQGGGQQGNYGAPAPGNFDDFDDEIPF